MDIPSPCGCVDQVHDGLIQSEKFWVSCYKASQPSVHALVNVQLDHADRDLVLTRTVHGDLAVTKNSDGVYSVTCPPLGIPPTRIVSPVQEYRDDYRAAPTRPHSITAFAVSPDSTRFATGYMDGSVLLCPVATLPVSPSSITPERVNTTKSKLISKPHLSVVTSLKFFPSSRVILSSGQDFSVCIIAADLPESSSYEQQVMAPPARVLRGHSATVTDTAIIGTGRNVISSSLDKKVRLWDVSSAEATATLFANGAVTAMSLGERTPPPDGEEAVESPSGNNKQFDSETSSKLVYCALKNGSFQLFDLGLKKSVYISPPQTSSSLTAIAYSPTASLLATGSSAGVVSIHDTRSLNGNPLISFSRLTTEIQDIAFTSNGSKSISLAIATSDGLPYVADVIPDGPEIGAELVGVDCDPVRHIVARDRGNLVDIWSASDDGVVRRYVYQ